MNKRLLIVEDDLDIANLMELHLNDISEHVVHVPRGDDGLDLALNEKWDLVILDLRLPGVSGLDICRRLREFDPCIPILMVTAKTTELDRVLGLEIGADDYITKPFSVVEFVARVRALLRRSSAMSQVSSVNTITINELTINVNEREARVSDKVLDLTPKEFELLLHFASHPGKVFKRTELLDKVWGYGHEGYEHTVNSHINRLRAKLEVDPVNPDYITTVWGVGYKMSSAAVA